MYDVRDITDATSEEYKEILDEEMIQNLDREYFKGIAAFDEKDVVKGVLIWCNKNVESNEDTLASIETVKTIEESCAGDLIEGYVKRADEDDVSCTTFELSDPEKEVVDAFKKNGFVTEEKESLNVTITLSDVESVKALNKKVGKNNIFSINEIDMLQFRKAVANCVFNGMRGLEEDISMLPKKWFEEDISCCIMNDDSVIGLFLIHALGNGALRPELIAYIGDDSEKHILDMMRFSADKALDKYERDKEVTVRRRNSKIQEMTNYFFPGKKGTTVTYGERKR